MIEFPSGAEEKRDIRHGRTWGLIKGREVGLASPCRIRRVIPGKGKLTPFTIPQEGLQLFNERIGGNIRLGNPNSNFKQFHTAVVNPDQVDLSAPAVRSPHLKCSISLCLSSY